VLTELLTLIISSGDVGVSAYLTLKGSPPFTVHYRVQKDGGASQEHAKVIPGARGEFTEIPDKSGRYSYTFVALSDANYKRITLDGPSIEQLVHPLASAEFAHRSQSGKRQINSCSTDSVDVDINLKV
jgi:nucleoporin POM152